MARRVRLSHDDYEIMLSHALKMWDEEACGLIAGVDHEDGTREIQKVYLLENKDHSSEHFTIDPRDQLEAVKDMRAHGLQPLGNWHSHPHTPSRQSAEDIRLAYNSRASYLILSLATKNAPVLHSFHTEGGVSTAEDLVIV